jgi:GNAT superfamily N-acetyltransferase
MMPTETSDPAVEAIESAFVAHWRHFGGYPGASLHESEGVTWFESDIAHLPYNGVIRSRIAPDAEIKDVVTHVAGRFRLRHVPFMWVQLPNDRPPGLSLELARQGLDMVEEATGMDLDLSLWRDEPNHSPAEVRVVADDAGMTDYEELIRTYWSVPPEDREKIRTLNRYWGTPEKSPGQRLVAYLDGKPVGKCFVNLMQVPDRVAVYGMAVLPEARGQGIATALMNRALDIGRRAGAQRAVLHSSHMARPLYARMGFVARCRLCVYATGPLFGTHHH